MRFEIISLTSGEKIAVVEAASAAIARRPYRMCKAVEIKDTIPGKDEYERYLWWLNSCKETAKDNRDLQREDYHLNIMGVGGETVFPMPKYPLTEKETEAAKKYAEFIGVKF